MRRLIVGALSIVILAWALNAVAQGTAGTISGTVTDTTGAVLPGAKLTILNEDTGVSRMATSDAAGRYNAPALSLGNYRVTAALEGFETEVRKGIVLTVGREAVVNLQLSVGAVNQSVEVTGEAPLVETTEATVGYLVNDKTIRELPLNGRDIGQLILLNPGVAQAENSIENKSYSGFARKISISGQRGDSNIYLLDGSYINDYRHFIPAGPSGALLGVETVREFQVLTNSYGAQYRGDTGGVFNAASRSGTNQFHGSLYEYIRNNVLDAPNFFDATSAPPFRRNQFGATISGPFRKDQTFFFVAYEGMREALTNTQFNRVPDQNARAGIVPLTSDNCTAASGVPQAGGLCQLTISDKIKPYLPFFPLPTAGYKNYGDGTADYVFTAGQPTIDDFGQIRIDHQLSAKDSLFGRFTGSNSFRSTIQNYPEFHQNNFLNARLLTVAETHIFSPAVLNTFRVSFNRVSPMDSGDYPEIAPELLSVPGQPPPGLSPGSGITSWEGSPKPLDYFITNRFNFQDDINWTKGAHALQFGGMLERYQINLSAPNRPYGAWSFSNLTDFLRAVPSSLRGTPPQFGNAIRGYRQWFAGFYIQDDWKFRSNLTLNLGVRWEPGTGPVEVNNLYANVRNVLDKAPTTTGPWWEQDTWKNVASRFGFAWSPFSSDKTSVRGGIGLFYSEMDAIMYSDPATRVAPLFADYQVNACSAAPCAAGTGDLSIFPNALAVISAFRDVSFGTADVVQFHNFKNPHTLQYNVNIQQQLDNSSMLMLGFVANRGINLSSYGDYNIPQAFFDGVSLAVDPSAARLNPNFGGINIASTRGDSWYNGFTAAYKRQFTAGLQAQVSFTWSKVTSTADNPGKSDRTGANGGNIRYAYDPSVSKGLSGYHVGRVLNTNYTYELPFGRRSSGVVNRIVSGWQLSGIFALQDGQPFQVTSQSATALTNIGLGSTPNAIAGFTGKVIQGGPDQYFNPQAFSWAFCDWSSKPTTKPCEIGNVGKNTLTGPAFFKTDLGITKNMKLTERWNMQFRGEVFNLTNHPDFTLPSSRVFTNRTAIDPATGQTIGTFDPAAGRIQGTVTTSRQIQFGLKLLF